MNAGDAKDAQDANAGDANAGNAKHADAKHAESAKHARGAKQTRGARHAAGDAKNARATKPRDPNARANSGDAKQAEVQVEQATQDASSTQVATKKKRRIAIDYIIDKNYANEYIQSWLALPFVNVIREDPNFHSFLNHNDLKKEITESFAVLVRVQQIIKRLYTLACYPPPTDTPPNSTTSTPPHTSHSISTSSTATPNIPNPSVSASNSDSASISASASNSNSDSGTISGSNSTSNSASNSASNSVSNTTSASTSDSVPAFATASSLPPSSLPPSSACTPSQSPSSAPFPPSPQPPSSPATNCNMTLEEFTEKIVLFDVCSGKGYAATLLTFVFPKLKIFMIDKDTKMNLQHLKSLPNVQMTHFDLFKKGKVQEWVRTQTINKIGLFLGTHLCGELSEMFVDIYNAVTELKGLVLAPCCLSKRKRIFADTAAKLKIDNYEYWTMHLYWMIQHSKKDINADSNVFSVKNNYISAVKC